VDVANRAELLKASADAVGGRIEREVSYIQTSVHRLLEPAR
jgi:succinylarginine dihydrolase